MIEWSTASVAVTETSSVDSHWPRDRVWATALGWAGPRRTCPYRRATFIARL